MVTWHCGSPGDGLFFPADDKVGIGAPTDRLTLTGQGVHEELFVTVVRSIYEQ